MRFTHLNLMHLEELSEDLPAGKWNMRRTKRGLYVLFIGDKRAALAYSEELARYMIQLAPERLFKAEE